MKTTFLTIAIAFALSSLIAQDRSDWIGSYPEACTSITVGKSATTDGSVIRSHTDDSHRTRSEMNLIPALDHKPGEMTPMYRRIA
ncbi:MAG: C69 family dipeptidase, partial [Bacteroidales bacterium]|nr:C69 family dipeptidase [Bacteroidales bacterium]